MQHIYLTNEKNICLVFGDVYFIVWMRNWSIRRTNINTDHDFHASSPNRRGACYSDNNLYHHPDIYGFAQPHTHLGASRP